jgi:hypothetical protein
LHVIVFAAYGSGDFRDCIISHSAATAAVVNFKEAHVFEKLRSNFSKTCASKEFYSPPLAAA